jgi:hypothetical protein
MNIPEQERFEQGRVVAVVTGDVFCFSGEIFKGFLIYLIIREKIFG